MHIEQIADLASRVKTIKNELSVKIKREFEEKFNNPFVKVYMKLATIREYYIILKWLFDNIG